MGGKFARIASIVGALTVAAAPLGAAAAEAGCRLAKLAELPVTMEGLTPIVSAKVNGQPVRLVVDSGAFFSLITPRSAERLKMRVSDLPAGFYIGTAVGTTSAQLGVATSFEVGGLPFQRTEFLVAGDSLGEADGLLGQNVLGRLDVEYDFANGVVRIFKAEGCEKAMLAYWASQPSLVSIMAVSPTTPVEPHIAGHAMVNDLPIKVVFDTGAGRSLLNLSAALRAGAKLDATAAEADEAMHGVGRRATDSYILPFSSFELGNETIKNIRLRVARSDFTIGDMLLGGDFFLSHHVMVSPSQRRLYFTYNGGPVFRLDDAGVRSNPFTPAATTASGAADAAGASLNADGLRRRAAAAAARHDFARAIADLDQAIGLDQKNAALYYDRARWRALDHGPRDTILADLDKSLTLKPDLADALVFRGNMRLSAGAIEKAQGDFEAALKAAPGRPETEMAIADAYLQARQFDRAIASYDAWLAKYPNSFEVGEALNGRCWTRALWGRELDKALADCNQALRRGSRLAQVLDSRGMVHLRRGEFARAIADYDAALKLQPKLAPSLYARGLAKRKAGDEAGATADLRAALALDPNVGEWMGAFGITDATVVVASMR